MQTSVRVVRRPINVIAIDIMRNWKSPDIAALPYIRAMTSCTSVYDHCGDGRKTEAMYGADTVRSVLLYFLNNASTWRGEVARRIKAELNEMLKEKS